MPTIEAGNRERPLRIGIAGLGTVGAGAARLIAGNADLITHRVGRPLQVVAVSARNRDRDRGLSLHGLTWHDDPVAVARDPAVDVVVELIGGDEGAPRRVVESALVLGKPVVTANKSLLARHGAALGAMAAKHGATIGFEASVASGIPIIKALREGLAANRFSSVSGILNGTSNFILSEMRRSRRPFEAVLREAQERGYAEADPTLDIDGHDSAHKLAILAAVAFGIPVDMDAVFVQGIRGIAALDIEYAEDLGYRIKLVGTASRTLRGIEQRVHPTMVPATAPLAMVEGVDSAIVVDSDAAGRIVLQGPGAGAGPAASAVVSDLIDLARGRHMPSFLPGADGTLTAAPIGEHDGPYYVRFMVMDQAGVIADIATELRNEAVSVDALIQRHHQPGGPLPVVLTTHPSQETRLMRALAKISALGTVVEPPRMFRIEPETA